MIVRFTIDKLLGLEYNDSGVRPAFCVSSDEAITVREDVIPDEAVYVLE